MSLRFAFAGALCLVCLACQPDAPSAVDAGATNPDAVAPPSSDPAVYTQAGPARTLAALPALSDAASVVKLAFFDEWNAHVYATAGGDPAINGLYTHVVMHGSPMEDGREFFLGDFNDWSVVESTPTSATLKISRSWIDDATGEARTVEEYMMLAADPGGANLLVTPMSARPAGAP